MAMVLRKRGLTTQAYGVQNAGVPGDLASIDFGSFTQRPYGPKLSGWASGWSAHNSSLNARHIFSAADGVSFQAASQELTCGCKWAVYKFGPEAIPGPGTNRTKLIEAESGYGGGSQATLYLNVVNMSMDIQELNALFATQTSVVTPRRHNWLAFGVGWEMTQAWNGSNSKWTLRFQMVDHTGTLSTLYTATNVNYLTSFMQATHAGTLWENNGAISARIGLPSLYTMTSIRDMTFPSDILLPLNASYSIASTEIFHVASSAVGGGAGTTLATAWTSDEARTEMASGNYTVPSGGLVDASNNQIDTTAVDADLLKQRIFSGTYKIIGGVVYYSDDSGPLRFVTTSATHQLALPKSIGGSFHSGNPSLGRMVDARATVRHTSGWALHTGAIWKKTITSAFPVVFEFDTTAAADLGNAPRWLVHPTAADLATYLAAATEGSFWSDGTTVYLWATGSGNPNSNGKIYEVTVNNAVADGDAAGSDFWHVSGSDIIVYNMDLKLCAAVSNDNSGASAALGRCLTSINAPGLSMVRNCFIRSGGKHNLAYVPAQISTSAGHSRFVVVDTALQDCRPASYSGAGGQSILVEDVHRTADDGQWYYENVVVTTNAGSPGSITGIVDITQPTMLEHNDGGAFANEMLSKGWVINCKLPGQCNIGVVTSIIVMQDTVFGYAGATSYVGGFGGVGAGVGSTTLTMTGCTGTGNSLPTLKSNVSTGVLGNVFIVSGSLVASSWAGFIDFRANTVDYTAAVVGAASSLFSEGGTIVLNLGENAFKGGTADIAIFSGGVHAQETMTWDYNQYDLPPAAVIARGYNDGSTTADRTLTAWKSLFGGIFDAHGGTDNASLGLSSSVYRPLATSPVIGAVALIDVPSLRGAADMGGNLRGATGNTEAGAWVYQSGRDRGKHTSVTSYA